MADWHLFIRMNSFSKLSSSDPLTYGVTLGEAKKYLRVDHAYDDDVINLLITGSLNAAENFLGYPITSRSMAGKYVTGWTVEVAPFYVKEVSYVKTGSIAESGSMSANDYSLHQEVDASYLYFNVLPTTTEVSIKFNTGDLTIPADVKLAMLKWVVDNYEQRTSDVIGVSVAKSSFAFDHLLHANKKYSV